MFELAETVGSKLAALVEAVNHLKERSEEDRENLKGYHEKLGLELHTDRKSAEAYRAAVQEELIALRGGQDHILRRVEVVEPIASMVMSFRAQMAGAAIVLGLIGSIIIWMLTYFRDILTKSLLS